jgi:DNA-binding NarL/FixJ family response regulator
MRLVETTIVLVDDHTIVRQGLRKLLEDEEGFTVVGEARDGREAVAQVEKLAPHVVIMDVTMPSLNGIEATRQIKKLAPDTKVIILSMHSHDRYISELLALGASGYLLKDSSGDDIVRAVDAARQGKTYLSPTISKKVVDELVSLKGQMPQDGLYNKLSNREREVMQLIAEGHPTSKIADILCVSPSTVKTHRAKIMEKLELDNLSQLVQFAIRLGLVDLT